MSLICSSIPKNVSFLLPKPQAKVFSEKYEKYSENPSEAMAVELFGVEAAIRLEALKDKRKQWQERLQDYKQERNAIKDVDGFDELDRDRAVLELLERSFDENEQKRVLSLERAGLL